MGEIVRIEYVIPTRGQREELDRIFAKACKLDHCSLITMEQKRTHQVYRFRKPSGDIMITTVEHVGSDAIYSWEEKGGK